MASSALKNPRYYSGPRPELVTMRAADSVTWKAGQPMTVASGLVTPASTNAVAVRYIAAADQDTSTDTTDVAVYRIPGASTKFVGYVSNDSSDTTAQRAHIAVDYGIDVISNVATVNVGEATKVAVSVDDVMWVREPRDHASSDDPDQVVFHYKQAIIDA